MTDDRVVTPGASEMEEYLDCPDCSPTLPCESCYGAIDMGLHPSLDVTYYQPTNPTDPAPDIEQMIVWYEEEGGCEATDGCWVEPDGTCQHGCQSWLLKLGLI